LKSILRSLSDFFSLVYPQICVVCGVNLFKQETVLCSKCNYNLPCTNFNDLQHNEVSRLFWGRIPIQYSTSYFYYIKGSQFQNILYNLKYEGKKYIGTEMGKIFGMKLIHTDFCSIDVIHPVPLHIKKLKRRGYNQSEMIAKGIAEGLNKPLITDAIIRIAESDTQTVRSRYERWQNVKGIFKIVKKNKLSNKHILLVDDVVTTGSTLESCAIEMLDLDNTKVSIATLAFAKIT